MSNLTVLDRISCLLQKYELPDRRPFFQLKNFVLGQECTIQGQMWQIIRELTSLQANLEAIRLQIEDSEDEIELIDIKIAELQQKAPGDELRQRKLQIYCRKLNRRKKSLQDIINKLNKKIDSIMEEGAFFVQAFDALAQHQECKSFDDAGSQNQYWNEKLSEELTFNLLLKNRLNPEFVRHVLALDESTPVRKQLVGILQSMQQNFMQDQQQFLEAQEKRKQIEHG